MKDDRLYLLHIQDAMTSIEEFISDGKESLDDRKTRDAVLRNMHTLSESLTKLSDEFKLKHAAVPWEEIAGFRNVVVHDYLGLDFEEIWEIIENDLPSLKKWLAPAMAEIGNR